MFDLKKLHNFDRIFKKWDCIIFSFDFLFDFIWSGYRMNIVDAMFDVHLFLCLWMF